MLLQQQTSVKKNTTMTTNCKLMLPCLIKAPHTAASKQRYRSSSKAECLLEITSQRSTATSTTHPARIHFPCWLWRAFCKVPAPTKLHESAMQQHPTPNTAFLPPWPPWIRKQRGQKAGVPIGPGPPEPIWLSWEGRSCNMRQGLLSTLPEKWNRTGNAT